jgi:hypothetical protein
MTDARFEDGAERPVRLRAETAEDLEIVSALVQDAVAQVADAAWTPRRRRFTLLVNRFRWEDAPAAVRQNRPYERVRALLSVGAALSARAQGLDPAARETVVSLLAIGFEPTADGAGVVRLTLAGDGEIAIEVEALDVTLTDVSRPYLSPSRRMPAHRET